MDCIFYPNRMIRADFPKLRSYFLECSSIESMTENVFAFAIINSKYAQIQIRNSERLCTRLGI